MPQYDPTLQVLSVNTGDVSHFKLSNRVHRFQSHERFLLKTVSQHLEFSDQDYEKIYPDLKKLETYLKNPSPYYKTAVFINIFTVTFIFILYMLGTFGKLARALHYSVDRKVQDTAPIGSHINFYGEALSAFAPGILALFSSLINLYIADKDQKKFKIMKKNILSEYEQFRLGFIMPHKTCACFFMICEMIYKIKTIIERRYSQDTIMEINSYYLKIKSILFNLGYGGDFDLYDSQNLEVSKIKLINVLLDTHQFLNKKPPIFFGILHKIRNGLCHQVFQEKGFEFGEKFKMQISPPYTQDESRIEQTFLSNVIIIEIIGEISSKKILGDDLLLKSFQYLDTWAGSYTGSITDPLKQYWDDITDSKKTICIPYDVDLNALAYRTYLLLIDKKAPFLQDTPHDLKRKMPPVFRKELDRRSPRQEPVLASVREPIIPFILNPRRANPVQLQAWMCSPSFPDPLSDCRLK